MPYGLDAEANSIREGDSGSPTNHAGRCVEREATRWNMGKPCGEWIEDGETVTYDPCPPGLEDGN